MKANNPVIVAHRGASYIAPENTIPAFNVAFNEKADFIEGDFWLTADNEIVCIHDSDTYRIGKKKISITSSYLSELKKIYVGFWKGEQFAGTRIPTLQEVLQIIPNGKGIHIEIKDNREKLLIRLKEIFIELNVLPGNVRIISFHRNIIRASKKYLPEFKTYLIFGWYFSKGNVFKSLAQKLILNKIQTVNSDGVVLYSGSYIDENFITDLKNMNLDICTYNVEDTQKAIRLTNFGVDSLTTNSPLMIRKAIQTVVK